MMTDSSKEMTFDDLGVSSGVCEAIKKLGWDDPSPIQIKAIPAGLTGTDLVGVAQTGTGKTGAFLIPCIDRMRKGQGMQVLALCPTRELAQQVCEDAISLMGGSGKKAAGRAASIYGGVGYDAQVEALKSGVEIITATPGRFLDLMGKGMVKFNNLDTLIFDEADRMLDMGFRPQIEEILKKIRGNRQTMLFSATMPNGVHDLASRITKDPTWIEIAKSGTKADGITEFVYSVKPDMKTPLLIHLLENQEWTQVLVFTRTKSGAGILQKALSRKGVSTGAMHSDLNMRQRTKALEKFADKSVRVLVATDIAQRGLDVDGISHVVNYDVPSDPEDYTHRIGRTARAGMVGTAVTFLSSNDLGAFKSLIYHLGRDLAKVSLPEFDYVGSSQLTSDKKSRNSRSAGGMGSKNADELTAEELRELLGR